MKEAIKFIKYHKYFHSKASHEHIRVNNLCFSEKTLYTIGDLSKSVD